MRIVRTILIAMLVTASLPIYSFAAEPPLFQFEQQAQLHCPADTVVWTDAALHLYNLKGERWYGATKNGAYACLRDGEKAGYHPRRTPVALSAE
jgi:hypothetical protein